MVNPVLSAIFGMFEWYHILMLVAVIGLIVFLVIYRRRTM